MRKGFPSLREVIGVMPSRPINPDFRDDTTCVDSWCNCWKTISEFDAGENLGLEPTRLQEDSAYLCTVHHIRGGGGAEGLASDMQFAPRLPLPFHPSLTLVTCEAVAPMCHTPGHSLCPTVRSSWSRLFSLTLVIEGLRESVA